MVQSLFTSLRLLKLCTRRLEHYFFSCLSVAAWFRLISIAALYLFDVYGIFRGIDVLNFVLPKMGKQCKRCEPHTETKSSTGVTDGANQLKDWPEQATLHADGRCFCPSARDGRKSSLVWFRLRANIRFQLILAVGVEPRLGLTGSGETTFHPLCWSKPHESTALRSDPTFAMFTAATLTLHVPPCMRDLMRFPL